MALCNRMIGRNRIIGVFAIGVALTGGAVAVSAPLLATPAGAVVTGDYNHNDNRAHARGRYKQKNKNKNKQWQRDREHQKQRQFLMRDLTLVITPFQKEETDARALPYNWQNVDTFSAPHDDDGVWAEVEAVPDSDLAQDVQEEGVNVGKSLNDDKNDDKDKHEPKPVKTAAPVPTPTRTPAPAPSPAPVTTPTPAAPAPAAKPAPAPTVLAVPPAANPAPAPAAKPVAKPVVTPVAKPAPAPATTPAATPAETPAQCVPACSAPLLSLSLTAQVALGAQADAAAKPEAGTVQTCVPRTTATTAAPAAARPATLCLPIRCAQ